MLGSQELMTEAITSSATVTSNEFSGDCQIRPSILAQKLLSPQLWSDQANPIFAAREIRFVCLLLRVYELLGVLLRSGKWGAGG